MTKRLVFEVDEGNTKCNCHCPFYLDDGNADCRAIKANFFDCDTFNLATLRQIKDEDKQV